LVGAGNRAASSRASCSNFIFGADFAHSAAPPLALSRSLPRVPPHGLTHELRPPRDHNPTPRPDPRPASPNDMALSSHSPAVHRSVSSLAIYPYRDNPAPPVCLLNRPRPRPPFLLTSYILHLPSTRQGLSTTAQHMWKPAPRQGQMHLCQLHRRDSLFRISRAAALT
jgi:hypothetical protein